MADRASLANRVRAERKRKRWSQQELAEKAGVTLGVIGGLERQMHTPTPVNQRAILEALGIEDDAESRSRDHLIRDDGDEELIEDTRRWPRDVWVLLDVMGLYLSSVPGERRTAPAHAITRFVYDLAREQGAG